MRARGTHPVRTKRIGRHLLTALLIAAICAPIDAQIAQRANPTDSGTTRSTTFALSIAVLKKQFRVDEKPWVFLTVENLSGGDRNFPEDRVYVEGENSEPPTTLRQRQLTNRLNPGETSLMSGGFEPTIHSGSDSMRRYDLSLLYDLSKPGKYIVYIEVDDPKTGVSLRSPTATFEIQPTQAIAVLGRRGSSAENLGQHNSCAPTGTFHLNRFDDKRA
jgi:hypothetical protein